MPKPEFRKSRSLSLLSLREDGFPDQFAGQRFGERAFKWVEWGIAREGKKGVI